MGIKIDLGFGHSKPKRKFKHYKFIQNGDQKIEVLTGFGNEDNFYKLVYLEENKSPTYFNQEDFDNFIKCIELGEKISKF